MIYQTDSPTLSVGFHDSFDFPPHSHHSIELFLCTEGTCEVSCNFRNERLQVGDVMIAFPNDIHSYSAAFEGVGIIIIVSPILLGEFMSDISKMRYENFVFSPSPDVRPLAEALLREYNQDASMEIMVGYLHVILGTLIKQLSHTAAVPSDAAQLSRILQYISEHYTEKLTLGEISRQFGFSEAHLSRTFSQRLSCGFLRYLHILRVDHAEFLLQSSQMSVSEIALSVGFSDIRTFNRVFRERRGMTPTQYRAINKKGDGSQ